jgi:hypothetical protein
MQDTKYEEPIFAKGVNQPLHIKKNALPSLDLVMHKEDDMFLR